MGDRDISIVITAALKEDPQCDEDQECEEAFKGWLRGEGDAAKIIPLSAEPAAIRDLSLDRHAYGLELERRKKARREEAAVVEFAARESRPESTSAAPLTAACSRHVAARFSKIERRKRNKDGEVAPSGRWRYS